MYYLQVIVRRKITLKINAGNEKDSFNVTLHKIKWKSIFDVKNIFWSGIENMHMIVKQ